MMPTAIIGIKILLVLEITYADIPPNQTTMSNSKAIIIFRLLRIFIFFIY